jgi:hypothetical protein
MFIHIDSETKVMLFHEYASNYFDNIVDLNSGTYKPTTGITLAVTFFTLQFVGLKGKVWS